ncbi:MAG: hypothetical protein J6B37_04045 [Clostridia bacterium]|nr:hypothetical protein [Clostridia bacterium]
MKKILSVLLVSAMLFCLGLVSFATENDGVTTTINKQYLEPKVDTHKHSFDGDNECICGLKKADYSGYQEAKHRYDEIVANNDLNDTAKDYLYEKMNDMIDEYLDGMWLRNNYSEEEQYILDGLEEGFNNLCDDLEAGIADGSFIKPDYTQIEAKIAELEEKDVDNQFKDEIGSIKTELQQIKATNPESMAEIADELATLNIEIDSVSEKIDKYNNCDHNCHKDGIAGCFWKIKLFFSKIFGINQICECGIAHY